MKFYNSIRITLNLLLFFILSPQIFSQEINWDNFSFGAVVQYSFSNGDLYQFWGNIPSAGFLFQYKINEEFIFEGSILSSYLKHREENQDKVPNIILLNMPAGLKFNFILKNNFRLNLMPGLANTTFIFLSEAAEKVGDNFIESEFGVYFSLGAGFLLTKEIWIEIFSSVQNIFSSPENLALYNFGLKLLWE